MTDRLQRARDALASACAEFSAAQAEISGSSLAPPHDVLHVSVPTPESMLVTQEQLAQILRISLRTLRRKVNDGTIPRPLKIARSVFWKRTDLAAWIEGMNVS